MKIYLLNPSHVSFGIGVITPRWLYVLASATPTEYGTPILIDETLEPFDPAAIRTGDVVGIGIHSGNALRGYELGTAARAAGAYVVFGGIHAPYLWLRTRDKASSWAFFDRLLGEAQIVGTPGAGFGPAGEGYFRLSAFNSRANIEEAIGRIRRVFGS
jgi:hypothetical protein